MRISDWSSDVCSSDLCRDRDLDMLDENVLTIPRCHGDEAAICRCRRLILLLGLAQRDLFFVQIVSPHAGQQVANRLSRLPSVKILDPKDPLHRCELVDIQDTQQLVDRKSTRLNSSHECDP